MLTRTDSANFSPSTSGHDMDALLPRDLIGAVVSKVGTAKQLCTILQLCKSWRAALTDQELEAI